MRVVRFYGPSWGGSAGGAALAVGTLAWMHCAFGVMCSAEEQRIA